MNADEVVATALAVAPECSHELASALAQIAKERVSETYGCRPPVVVAKQLQALREMTDEG
jgi:hypothetical protein